MVVENRVVDHTLGLDLVDMGSIHRDHTTHSKVTTRLVQGSRLIPVLAQTPGRDLSNTKGSVQRPELNLWFSLVKVQLAEAYSQYFTKILVTVHKHFRSDRR